MAKLKTKFICQQCGYESSGYLGKCPQCNTWGSFVEELSAGVITTKQSTIFDDTTPQLIKEIALDKTIRTQTGFNELDRVLGGGLVQGSVVLLTGDPGIGKSTLVLQACNKLCSKNKKTLYASAEESTNQIKLRAERLGINNDNLYIYAQNNLENIKAQIKELKPETVIIDSIQAIYTENISSSSGSVSQIRECCSELMLLAKSQNITVIIVGHVTKDGNIAGPKVLEHIVDTVLYFEGDKYKTYRILRATKNRFGTTNEIGMFDMQEAGLIEITNANELFLKEIQETNTPGSAIIVANEGTRPLLVEIQALVGASSYQNPRRITNGVDSNRVLQIIAVLEKRVGLNLSRQDIYVNVIGGFDITEPAADLGIALAITTCINDVVLNPKTAIIGEIGLSGEIRAVNNLEKRIIEAQKLGFEKIIIPDSNTLNTEFDTIKVIRVKKIIDAISSSIGI